MVHLWSSLYLLSPGLGARQTRGHKRHGQSSAYPDRKRSPALLRRISAVDDKLSAGHELRLIRGEVDHAISDMLRLAGPADLIQSMV